MTISASGPNFYSGLLLIVSLFFWAGFVWYRFFIGTLVIWYVRTYVRTFFCLAHWFYGSPPSIQSLNVATVLWPNSHICAHNQHRPGRANGVCVDDESGRRVGDKC